MSVSNPTTAPLVTVEATPPPKLVMSPKTDVAPPTPSETTLPMALPTAKEDGSVEQRISELTEWELKMAVVFDDATYLVLGR